MVLDDSNSKSNIKKKTKTFKPGITNYLLKVNNMDDKMKLLIKTLPFIL